MGKINESTTVMKILHIGLMVNGRNEGLSKDFQKEADLYAEFPPNYQLPHQINSLGWTPDLVFIQIQDDKIRNGREAYDTCTLLGPSLERLKNAGAFIINWTGDKRHTTPDWMVRLVKYVSVTAFSNQEDVDYMTSLGHASGFLQIGIDPYVFKKWPPATARDIVFMGNNHGRYPLSIQRASLVQFLQHTYKDKFGLYGNYPGNIGNLNANGNDPFPMQSQESKIYSSCKIGISISHFDSDRYTSDRLFRIMGSGCFALSHHYKGIEKDFEVGKHLDTFRDRNELKQKIDFYLENEDERKQIAKNGFDLVHSKHTYNDMVEDIKKMMR